MTPQVDGRVKRNALRMLRWTCTATLACVLLMYAVSDRWALYWARKGCSFSVLPGAFLIGRSVPGYHTFEVLPHQGSKFHWSFERWHLAWVSGTVVPMWAAAVVVALPTGLLWLRPDSARGSVPDVWLQP